MTHSRLTQVMLRVTALFLLLFLLSTLSAVAQSAYQPSPENLQARREFQDMTTAIFLSESAFSSFGID